MTQEIQAAAQVIRAANHPIRWAIIQACQQKETTVGEIQKIVSDLDALKRTPEGLQSVASQHLAILRACRLVTTRRDGKYVYYQTDTEVLSKLHRHCHVIAQLQERNDKATQITQPSNAVEL